MRSREDPVLTDPIATPAAADVVERVLAGRWSCRGFLDRPVPIDVIRRMLEMAQRAPSWCNTQPWELIVTGGDATERLRKALSEYAGEHEPAPDIPFPSSYTGVRQERRRAVAWQLYESVGVARGDRVASQAQTNENFRLFGAPHAAILTTEAELGVYGTLDCGFYLGALVLAAQSLGLATIAQAALAMHSPFMHEYFDIPPNRLVVGGISFGYADPAHPANGFRAPRAAVDDVVTFLLD